jgi:YhcH/YjgK/YiaL family protein
MIIDQLTRASAYTSLHPRFEAAFDAIGKVLAGAWPTEDRLDVDGNRLYILPMAVSGKGRAAVRAETHRRYIDIQYVASGTDTMGWSALDAIGPGNGYDRAKDIEFYPAVPSLWVPVLAGHFAIFLPSDVHAPLAGEGMVRKLVVKILV